MSKGEELLGELLELYLNKEYLKVLNFNAITVLKNKRPSFLYGLELDYYIPELQLAFEFQGEQHYDFIDDFYYSNEQFVRRIFYDIQKDYLCNMNNIELIRVNAEGLQYGAFRNRIRTVLSRRYGYCILKSDASKLCILPTSEYSKIDKLLYKFTYIDFCLKLCLSENDWIYRKRRKAEYILKVREYLKYLQETHQYNSLAASNKVSRNFYKIMRRIKDLLKNNTIKADLSSFFKPGINLETLITHSMKMSF